MIGVQANFSLAAKLIQQNLEVDISDNYKRTYSDLILGFSVVPADRNIDLTFRYNLGLSNNIIGTNHTTSQTQRKDVIYIGLKIGI